MTTLILVWNQSWAWIISSIITAVLVYFCFAVFFFKTIYGWWKSIFWRLPIIGFIAGFNGILLNFLKEMKVMMEPDNIWQALTDPALTSWMKGVEFPFWVIPLVMIISANIFLLIHYFARGQRRGKFSGVRNQVKLILQSEPNFTGGTINTWKRKMNHYSEPGTFSEEEIKDTLYLLLYEGKIIKPDVGSRFTLKYMRPES